MSRERLVSRRRRNNGGFTIVELLVYLALSGIVMGSIYQLLIGQTRSYTGQREMIDSHSSLRAAAALLSWELRQASAVNGDLYDVKEEWIVMRSVQGTGIVCAEHGNLPRFGLFDVSGEIGATPDDSAMIFASGGVDGWEVMQITKVATAATLGVGNCVWPGTPKPDVAIEVQVATIPDDTSGILVGAPVRAFRLVQYRTISRDGRHWLGRKVGAAAGYDVITGPLQEDTGLQFRYFDASGAETNKPDRVAVVEFTIRVESFGRVRGSSSGFRVDTLTTRVALRG